jgi:ADP-heptose:LPS heptosyltransferase
LLHPGSGSKRKNWHISNFKRVAEILVSDGKQIEFVLGPAEHFMADMLAEGASERIIRKISDLPELLSLLRTAGGFIGNDSGVSHLSAFLGLPTVAVFGPSDPQRWKPAGRSVATVRPDNLDCRPCFEINSENCDSTECLNRTSPENIVRAFYELK